MKIKSVRIFSLVGIAGVGALALAGCIHPKLEPAPPTGAEVRAEERVEVAAEKAEEVAEQVAEDKAEAAKAAEAKEDL